MDFKQLEEDARNEIEPLYEEFKAMKKKIYTHLQLIRTLKGSKFDYRLQFIFKEVAPKQILQQIEERKRKEEERAAKI